MSRTVLRYGLFGFVAAVVLSGGKAKYSQIVHAYVYAISAGVTASLIFEALGMLMFAAYAADDPVDGAKMEAMHFDGGAVGDRLSVSLDPINHPVQPLRRVCPPMVR